MKYQWDEKKRQEALRKHGVDFADVKYIDWELKFEREDIREDYGETRFATMAPIKGRLHVMIWCWRGNVIRVISLRKANQREEKDYEEKLH